MSPTSNSNSLLDSLILCYDFVDEPPAGESFEFSLRSSPLSAIAEELVSALCRSKPSKDHVPYLGRFLDEKRRLASAIAGEKRVNRQEVASLYGSRARTLATQIGKCLSDDLIPRETKHFFSSPDDKFQGEELPPWDTWIDVEFNSRDAAIISWVPAWAEKHVDKAIEIDYLKIYSWRGN